MELSPQQEAVMSWASSQEGHLNLVARAGTGKTTTLIEMCSRVSGTIFLGAYNKKIAEEIKMRLQERNLPLATASTMHAAGFGAWKRVSPSCEVQGDKLFDICRKNGVAKDAVAPIVSVVSLGKQSLFIPETEETSWQHLWDHFEIELDLPFSQQNLATVRAVLEESIQQNDSIVDFDDMIYAPCISGTRVQTYDWVLIDEAQDTNPARRELAIRMLNGSGRLVAVGDEKQAIYGFCHPAGTKVMTPTGFHGIEDMKVGDLVVISNTSGETEGWSGNKRVLKTHRYIHTGRILILQVGENHSVSMTPHHRVPVRIGPTAYYTYMMRRCGVFRVGSCKAFTDGQFMLQLRRKQEHANSVWILGAHSTKKEARNVEALLLKRVKGTTFSRMSDETVRRLPTDDVEALQILSEHGRMLDFPLLGDAIPRRRIARNGAFIAEACNLIDGMLAAFYADDQIQRENRKGKNRQKFSWTPLSVSSKPFSGFVYGITVPDSTTYRHDAYYQKGMPLYFSGTGILVHNTGADSDAMQLIQDRLGSVSLPLTITYRCPKSVVHLAQTWVKDIEAFETNPEGAVRELPEERFSIQIPGNQDVILCRNSKPLIELAYMAIKAGRGVRVEGREIGKGLLKLAQRFKEDNLREILPRLERYQEEETYRLREKRKFNQIQNLEDKCETLSLMISQSLETGGRTIQHLEKRIESLFGDTYGKQTLLTLSTIHKAKGREWDHVWLWGRNRYQPSYYAKLSLDRGVLWPMEQEENLCYVAVTRAKKILTEIVVENPFKPRARE